MKQITFFFLSCFWLFFLLISCNSEPILPITNVGTVLRKSDLPSAYVPERIIEVWLPEHYDGEKEFGVLYMHDGQMLFDSTTTWNKQAWDVDDVAQRLMDEGVVSDFIVVGVWNGGANRHAEYFPQRPFEAMPPQDQEWVIAQLQEAGRTKDRFVPNSDAYLKSLVEEVKPYIESNFRVKTGPEHTRIAGSSMGGLISWYALCEYPEVFGGAACISTHWPGTFSLENNPVPDAFMSYLRTNLPDPNTHKLYFDCGDQTLDALYPVVQQRVDTLMMDSGYAAGNWKTAYFPGTDHSEASWKARLDVPLKFLFGFN
jgi:predicted alpha/beta superfamily hydrolase